MTGTGIRRRLALVALVALAALAAACTKKAPKYDTNLLSNASFEDVGSDGVPKGWKLVLFRGAPTQSEVRYGVDTLAADGKRSWFFQGDPGTRRWYLLQHEVPIWEGETHVRIRGFMQTDGVRMRPQQFAQCNLLLTFYDKDHNRFQEERAADRRTPLCHGTNPWEEQVYTFVLPKGTRYIAVSCALGMNGQVWFDNLSLEIPKPVPWETATTKNYVFHWLPGHPMPQGAPEVQQQVFDYAASKLGVNSDVVINYFFYPDTSTIRQMTGTKVYLYINWDDHEFHSINPRDDHELVHFITDSIGRPPRSLAEGTVFWIQDQWNGVPLDDLLRSIVRSNRGINLVTMFDTNLFMQADIAVSLPMSGAFVKFIVERWGPAKLIELYRSTNGMNSYPAVAKGFEAVYGLPMQDADEAWQIWMRTNYGKK